MWKMYGEYLGQDDDPKEIGKEVGQQLLEIMSIINNNDRDTSTTTTSTYSNDDDDWWGWE